MELPITIPPLKTPVSNPLPRPLPRPFNIDPSCVLYLDFIDKINLDESGKGNHPTFNGPTRTPAGYSFPGVDDFIEIPDDISIQFGTGDFWMFGWVKDDEIKSNSVILNKVEDWQIGLIALPSFLLESDNNNLKFDMPDGISRNTTATTGNSITQGEWFKFDVFRKLGDLEIWIDGVNQVLTLAPTTTDSISGIGRSLRLGFDDNDARGLNGAIAEIGFMSRPPTEIEILNMYEFGRARLGV